MKKIFTSLILLTGLFFIPTISKAAGIDNENITPGKTMSEMIISSERSRTLPDFDLSIKLKETENRLLDAINKKLNKSFSDTFSNEYLEILTSLSNTNEYKLSDTESENIEFSEFAAIYTSTIFENSTLNDKEVLLNKSYDEIKQENISSFLEAEKQGVAANQLKKLQRSDPFNYAKGTAYAIKHATSYNPLYQSFKGAGDCTKFASQIAFAGGKKKVWAANASGMPWYWDKTNVYSHPWTVAHQFANYWLADGALSIAQTTKSAAQGSMKEGAFIAYWKKIHFKLLTSPIVVKKLMVPPT